MHQNIGTDLKNPNKIKKKKMFFTKCVLKTFLRGHKTSKQKIPELLEKSAEKHGFCNSKWAERSAIHPHPSEASFGKKVDIFRIFCFLMFSLFLFLFCSTFYKMLITFDLMLLKLIRGHVGSLKIFKSLICSGGRSWGGGSDRT